MPMKAHYFLTVPFLDNTPLEVRVWEKDYEDKQNYLHNFWITIRKNGNLQGMAHNKIINLNFTRGT